MFLNNSNNKQQQIAKRHENKTYLTMRAGAIQNGKTTINLVPNRKWPN